ncbi:MAG: hypothetical protein ACYTEY_07730, partial [Planctomycetota bacterium]
MRATIHSIGAACAILLPGVAWGQASPLCMVSFDTGGVVVIQGGAVVNQWNTSGAGLECGLAVQATIKMVGRMPGQNGAEYALDGTPLGGGPYFNPAYDSLYDGTTNGLNNWSVAHNDGATNFAVVVGDADWNNLQIAFVPTRRSSGITYAESTGTLWVANNFGGFEGLQEYDLAGNLLTDIPLPYVNGAGYGLAWDPADNTLWMTGGFGSGIDAYQLDFEGNILQEVDVPQISGNWISAEFLCPTLEEGFPNPLGGWNGRWLYQNSNLENYYVADGDCDPDNRGNNPTGLWIAEPQGCGSGVGGPVMEWVFDPAFAAALSHLEFGIEAFNTCDVTIYDVDSNVLSVGIYWGGAIPMDHADIVSADSENGISRVVFDTTAYGGEQIEGNTSIDNVVVTACPADTCPWDCGDGDGTVGIVDFLAMLAQWGGPGPCDFDGGGVSVTDFLLLLAHWGDCPGGITPEEEPNCGLPEDSFNGGCNSTPNVFSPIACGQTYAGTAAGLDGTRDTDWYEINTEE